MMQGPRRGSNHCSPTAGLQCGGPCSGLAHCSCNCPLLALPGVTSVGQSAWGTPSSSDALSKGACAKESSMQLEISLPVISFQSPCPLLEGLHLSFPKELSSGLLLHERWVVS